MDNLRQPHGNETHHRDNKPDDNKFDEEIRVDSGFGTLSISSELIPEELASLLGGNDLTADDIEKAFNVAASSTSSRRTESDTSKESNDNVQSKTKSNRSESHDSKRKPTRNAKQKETKITTATVKDAVPQKTKKLTISVTQLIADAYKQDDDGDTDLHLAIIHMHKQVTQIIINLAKNPKWLDLKNKLFQTPLYLASLTNQPDIVRMLLQYGARPELRNSKGYTPLHIAAKFGHKDCISELLQGSESNSFMGLRDYNGNTALHLAAKHDQVNAARALLHWGADPNEEDDCSGYTALHIATISGCSAIVRDLLHNPHTDPNQPSFAGVLPLDMAKYYYYPKIIKLLEDAGAMESDRDINRWTGDDSSDNDQPTYEMFSDSVSQDDNYEKIILLS